MKKILMALITSAFLFASASAATPWSCKDTPRSNPGYVIFSGKLYTCESATRYDYTPIASYKLQPVK